VLEKHLSMLRLRPVARVRIYDQLRIREVFDQKKGVDRLDDYVLAAVHDERWLTNRANIAKRFSKGIVPHSRIDPS
jgi:hypothetical protein